MTIRPRKIATTAAFVLCATVHNGSLKVPSGLYSLTAGLRAIYVTRRLTLMGCGMLLGSALAPAQDSGRIALIRRPSHIEINKRDRASGSSRTHSFCRAILRLFVRTRVNARPDRSTRSS